MRIGLQLPYFNFPDLRGTLASIARKADESGFYSLWVMDHFFQLGGPFLGEAEEPMLEGYTTLSYLAGVTENVKLGTLVTGVIYRQPALLVKAATTLDVLSGGRAYLGIGAAWYEREALALGFPFPSTSERFERLEEALQIAHQMWSENNGAYHGTHYQLQETLNNPQPISQPHPPIMIGGTGEKKTLRFVAQYGDACNIFTQMSHEDLQRKLEILRQHCADVGRNYDDIEKTGLDTAFYNDRLNSADEIITFCRQLADLGFQHMIFNMPNVQTLEPLEIFAREVIPAVKDF
ncbi:MAG: LLM class F420-dependent oxidoreductase [Anaerolineae bacterium]